MRIRSLEFLQVLCVRFAVYSASVIKRMPVCSRHGRVWIPTEQLGAICAANVAFANSLLAFHTFGHSSFLSAPTMLSRSNNHRRSASTELHRSSSPNRLLPRMKSSNALLEFRRNQRGSHAGLEDLPESNFSTLRDPRIASTTDLPQTAESEHHPDLNREVALLSQKLVQAINNQTSLDDSLAATRQELEQTRDRLEAVELENQRFREDLAQGVLVRRSDIDPEIRSLKAAVAEERAQRLLAEQGKKNIEQELETLTAALFEEANKVICICKFYDYNGADMF